MRSLGYLSDGNGRIVELSDTEWWAMVHLARAVPAGRCDIPNEADVDREMFDVIQAVAYALAGDATRMPQFARVHIETNITIEPVGEE